MNPKRQFGRESRFPVHGATLLYLTLWDGTQIVHSDLKEMPDGPHVLVHFEQPSNDGFYSVRFNLPTYEAAAWEGSLSEDDPAFFRRFLGDNAHLPYRHAALHALVVEKWKAFFDVDDVAFFLLVPDNQRPTACWPFYGNVVSRGTGRAAFRELRACRLARSPAGKLRRGQR